MKYRVQLADKYRNGYFSTSSLMYPEWEEVWEEIEAEWFEITTSGDLLFWNKENVNFHGIARAQWKRILINEDTSRV